MKVRRNLIITLTVLLLFIPSLNIANINNYVPNSHIIINADETLSSLPKSKIISIIKKGVHPSSMTLPHVSKHSTNVIVSYNTGANAGGRVTLTQDGHYVHVHVQPIQSKGTASPGGQTLKPTKNLSAASAHKTDANVFVAGLSSNQPKPSKTTNDSQSNSKTISPHQSKSHQTKSTNVNNQNKTKQHNRAIKKASVASITTFVVLLVLYIFKRILNRIIRH